MRDSIRPGLLLAALTASMAHGGERRYARVGEMQGTPEVQIHTADAWRAGERNLPLIEASRVRSGPQDRLEVELDDGSFLRLAGDALAELSDYTQLSTHQRVTLVSIDHGVAYFTGEPRVHDTLSIALPGTQITLLAGSRLRLAAYEQSSSVAVLEGEVKFTTPTMEMNLRTGQFLQIYAGAKDRFTLLREIPKLEADDWSEGRDKSTASSAAANYIAGIGYGLADLDRAGGWVQTPDSGLVWKPRTDANWRPFREGRWEWFDEAGYTWVARESWGWLPYHYGRWIEDASLGFVWSPDRRANPIYKPGEVYWLRGPNRLAWGPLAPNEVWTGAGRSQLYAPANSTVGAFTAGQRVIEAAGTDEKLAGMAFTVAPISPALAAERFEAQRPDLRTAETAAPLVTTAEPRVPQDEYGSATQTMEATPPPLPSAPLVMSDLISQPEYVEAPEPLETYIPVPVYSGIVVIDPPLWDEKAGRMGNPTAGSTAPGKGANGTSSGDWHKHGNIKVPEPPPEPHRITRKDVPDRNQGSLN